MAYNQYGYQDEPKKSLTWELTTSLMNPVENIKSQFFSGFWGYTTYRAQRLYGKTQVDPFFFLNITRKGLHKVTGFGDGVWAKAADTYIKKTTSGWLGLEGLNIDPKSTYQDILQKYNLKTQEHSFNKFVKYIRNNTTKQYSVESIKTTMSVSEETAKDLFKVAKRYSLYFKYIIPGMQFMYAGILAYDIGSLTAKAIGGMINTSTKIANLLNNEAKNISSLEFNKQLSNGYLSGGAATERQLAIQAMQRNPGLHRRFIGNEASFYSRY